MFRRLRALSGSSNKSGGGAGARTKRDSESSRQRGGSDSGLGNENFSDEDGDFYNSENKETSSRDGGQNNTRTTNDNGSRDDPNDYDSRQTLPRDQHLSRNGSFNSYDGDGDGAADARDAQDRDAAAGSMYEESLPPPTPTNQMMRNSTPSSARRGSALSRFGAMLGRRRGRSDSNASRPTSPKAASRPPTPSTEAPAPTQGRRRPRTLSSGVASVGSTLSSLTAGVRATVGLPKKLARRAGKRMRRSNSKNKKGGETAGFTRRNSRTSFSSSQDNGRNSNRSRNNIDAEDDEEDDDDYYGEYGPPDLPAVETQEVEQNEYGNESVESRTSRRADEEGESRAVHERRDDDREQFSAQGLPDETEQADVGETENDVVYQRVLAFYHVHNTEKVNDVDMIVDRYRGREDTLLRKLEQQYDAVVPSLLEAQRIIDEIEAGYNNAYAEDDHIDAQHSNEVADTNNRSDFSSEDDDVLSNRTSRADQLNDEDPSFESPTSDVVDEERQDYHKGSISYVDRVCRYAIATKPGPTIGVLVERTHSALNTPDNNGRNKNSRQSQTTRRGLIVELEDMSVLCNRHPSETAQDVKSALERYLHDEQVNPALEATAHISHTRLVRQIQKLIARAASSSGEPSRSSSRKVFVRKQAPPPPPAPHAADAHSVDTRQPVRRESGDVAIRRYPSSSQSSASSASGVPQHDPDVPREPTRADISASSQRTESDGRECDDVLRDFTGDSFLQSDRDSQADEGDNVSATQLAGTETETYPPPHQVEQQQQEPEFLRRTSAVLIQPHDDGDFDIDLDVVELHDDRNQVQHGKSDRIQGSNEAAGRRQEHLGEDDEGMQKELPSRHRSGSVRNLVDGIETAVATNEQSEIGDENDLWAGRLDDDDEGGDGEETKAVEAVVSSEPDKSEDKSTAVVVQQQPERRAVLHSRPQLANDNDQYTDLIFDDHVEPKEDPSPPSPPADEKGSIDDGGSSTDNISIPELDVSALAQEGGVQLVSSAGNSGETSAAGGVVSPKDRYIQKVIDGVKGGAGEGLSDETPEWVDPVGSGDETTLERDNKDEEEEGGGNDSDFTWDEFDRQEIQQNAGEEIQQNAEEDQVKHVERDDDDEHDDEPESAAPLVEVRGPFELKREWEHRRQQIMYAIHELLQTEANYAKELLTLDTHVCRPFSQLSRERSGLGRDDHKLFSNLCAVWSRLLRIHRGINHRLRLACLTPDGLGLQSAALDSLVAEMQALRPQLHVYGDFVTAYHKAMQVYTRGLAHSKVFTAFVSKCVDNIVKQHEEEEEAAGEMGDSAGKGGSRALSGLEVMWIKPVQRLCRYPLLVHAIAKHLLHPEDENVDDSNDDSKQPKTPYALVHQLELQLSEDVRQVDMSQAQVDQAVDMAKVHGRLRWGVDKGEEAALSFMEPHRHLVRLSTAHLAHKTSASVSASDVEAEAFHLRLLIVYNDVVLVTVARKSWRNPALKVYDVFEVLPLDGATVAPTSVSDSWGLRMHGESALVLVDRRGREWIVVPESTAECEDLYESLELACKEATDEHLGGRSHVVEMLENAKYGSTKHESVLVRQMARVKNSVTRSVMSAAGSSATKIQRTFRGMLGRKKAKRRKEEFFHEVRSAIIIQCAFRRAKRRHCMRVQRERELKRIAQEANAMAEVGRVTDADDDDDDEDDDDADGLELNNFEQWGDGDVTSSSSARRTSALRLSKEFEQALEEQANVEQKQLIPSASTHWNDTPNDDAGGNMSTASFRRLSVGSGTVFGI